jgi:hypothetical protein
MVAATLRELLAIVTKSMLSARRTDEIVLSPRNFQYA